MSESGGARQAAPDVVAELDRYVSPGCLAPFDLVRRARDEIVALREKLRSDHKLEVEWSARLRAEALEEAARVCDEHGAHDCATAIRALKNA